MSSRLLCLALAGTILTALPAGAQTRADYDRALGLREKYQNLTVGVPDSATWVGRTNRLYYRRPVHGGHECLMVDAETQARTPAFDHQRLADVLSKQLGETRTGESPTALRLPFNSFTFTEDERAIEMTIEQVRWRCSLSDYGCTKTE